MCANKRRDLRLDLFCFYRVFTQTVTGSSTNNTSGTNAADQLDLRDSRAVTTTAVTVATPAKKAAEPEHAPVGTQPVAGRVSVTAAETGTKTEETGAHKKTGKQGRPLKPYPAPPKMRKSNKRRAAISMCNDIIAIAKCI